VFVNTLFGNPNLFGFTLGRLVVALFLEVMIGMDHNST